MKVLHVYSHDNPRLAKYAALLSQAMPADVECAFADTPSDVRRAVKDFKPDIIHQHGHAIAYAQTRARLVVTPHGENIDTQRAYVVIARSPYERSTYERQAPKSDSQIQGHKAKRTVLVQNPLITRTISFDVAAETIAAIYRRIMDSHPLELMNDETRLLLAAALKAGLLGDKGWVDAQCSMLNAQCTMHNAQSSIFNFQSSIFNLQSSIFNFHHLLIYAELEGVLDIVLRGFDILGIKAPEKTPIDCYLPHGYTTPKPMPGTSVIKLLRDIERNGVTLLRLAELTNALYDDSLDEAALMKKAENEKLCPLLQPLLQILSEQTLLTEGFMPCTPLENDDTKRLRWQLENHLNPQPPNR